MIKIICNHPSFSGTTCGKAEYENVCCRKCENIDECLLDVKSQNDNVCEHISKKSDLKKKCKYEVKQNND